MPCVNHPGNPVQSYCQHCGKALCTGCVRTMPTGQIYCDTCVAAAASGVNAPGTWAGVNYPGGPAPGSMPGYSIPVGGGPNPAAAAVLGLIPGVGAMYNGQLFKGLIHVVIFAVLVSITDRYPIFGLFIAAWIFYQSFEAYHTARARRDGLPIPDPFGLNELGSWLNIGSQGRGPNAYPVTPPYAAPAGAPPPNPVAGGEPPIHHAPSGTSPSSSWTSSQYSGPASDPASYGHPGYPPQPPPYAEPWTGQGAAPDPFAQSYPPNYPAGAIPPDAIPPIPPYKWRRKEPVFAFVLIGLGIIFLLQSMGFVTNLLDHIWPFALIGLGVWLIMRRVSDSKGGPK